MGQFWGIFFLTDNALYITAFGTYTKTAEPIEMPSGMMSGLGPRNSALRKGDDPRRGRGNFGGNMPVKFSTPNNCELDWSVYSGTRPKQTLDCKCWTSLLSAAKWGWDCTPRAKSDIYDWLLVYANLILLVLDMQQV